MNTRQKLISLLLYWQGWPENQQQFARYLKPSLVFHHIQLNSSIAAIVELSLCQYSWQVVPHKGCRFPFIYTFLTLVFVMEQRWNNSQMKRTIKKGRGYGSYLLITKAMAVPFFCIDIDASWESQRYQTVSDNLCIFLLPALKLFKIHLSSSSPVSRMSVSHSTCQLGNLTNP